jgi:hypothetical protein
MMVTEDTTDQFCTSMDMAQMFGLSGRLMSYMKRLIEQGAGPEAIVGLITVVMRIAMFVADTWDYTSRRSIRTATEQPPYKWYYLGLATARETFKEMITDDDIDGTAIP